MISFIIPTYNREDTLFRTIESIKDSVGLKEYEIIVVDDNSSDNTLDKLKKYKAVKIIKNDVNKGPAVCRNQGIVAAKGDYLFLIDSDVFLTKDCFKKLYKEMQSNDIVFPTINFEDETRMYPSNENEERFLKASTVFMLRKDSLKRLDELFDSSYYMVEEDTDFFMRCSIFRLKCCYVRDAKAYHVLESNASFNLENKFYLTTRNQLYSLLKLSSLDSKVTELFDYPKAKLTMKSLIMALFNVNLLSVTSVEGRTKTRRNIFGKISMLFGKHPKITPRSRVRLIFLFIKALSWNVSNLGNTVHKRKRIKLKMHR